MGVKVGRVVWIPCEVRPGPFSDERVIRIQSDGGAHVAFVRVDALREPIAEGETAVRAVIVDVSGGTFHARVAGEPVTTSLFGGSLSRGARLAAV